MVRPRGRLKRDRLGQIAVADAVMALIILMVASTILYTTVAGVITSSSEARQRAEIRSTALSVGNMPLEASWSEVNLTSRSPNEDVMLVNLSGAELIGTYFEFLHFEEHGAAGQYDLSDLEEAIKDLYGIALRGRGYTVHVYTTYKGDRLDWLFSSQGTERAIMSVTDIPHPRVVNQKAVHHGEMAITVDLYLWK